MTKLDFDLNAGAVNLLQNCLQISTTESLLVICENPALGWYDAEAPAAVIAAAEQMGIAPTVIQVDAPENDRDPGITAAMKKHDCALFFSRIGDQDRFAEPAPGKKIGMSYARTAADLGSAYGRCHHQAMVALKQAVNTISLSANRVHITCPFGTDISGTVSRTEAEAAGDVSVRRFPLGVPQPLQASTLSGRVALTRFLTPTGSKTYEPPSLPIDDVAFAHVERGRIQKFSGPDNVVERISDHYRHVSQQFGIAWDAIDSFHAGIHPGCSYTKPAAADPDRWSNSVFTNPRVLHFHTCGDYAPGEICWMLIDHTLTLDGRPLWQRGVMCLDAFPETRACLETWPELAELAANPAREIGL